MLFPERLNIGSLAGGADGFDFGGKRGEASIALGRDGLYRRSGQFSQGGRRFALGGNLFAQLGHDFEQDIADEVFHFFAGLRVCEEKSRFARAAATAAPASIKKPGCGAPALFAGAGDLGGGGGMALQASLADAFGQLRVALYGQLDGTRADA
jgi:hypothetical protein